MLTAVFAVHVLGPLGALPAVVASTLTLAPGSLIVGIGVGLAFITILAAGAAIPSDVQNRVVRVRAEAGSERQDAGSSVSRPYPRDAERRPR